VGPAWVQGGSNGRSLVFSSGSTGSTQMLPTLPWAPIAHRVIFHFPIFSTKVLDPVDPVAFLARSPLDPPRTHPGPTPPFGWTHPIGRKRVRGYPTHPPRVRQRNRPPGRGRSTAGRRSIGLRGSRRGLGGHQKRACAGCGGWVARAADGCAWGALGRFGERRVLVVCLVDPTSVTYAIDISR
jgi:hypothetical protein